MSASTTLRWAVVEWTGTADSIPKDIVNDWTNGTFTTGNFFLSSGLTIVGTGSLALAANTLADCISNAIGTVSGSMNNLYLFIWTDSAQAQNVTLDVGNVWFGQGASAPPNFDLPQPDADRNACMRYYQLTATGGSNFAKANGIIFTSTSVRVLAQIAVPMRATPTFSIASGDYSQLLIRAAGTTYTQSAITVQAVASDVTTCGVGLIMTVTGAAANNPCSITSADNWIFDARL